jgi:CBS domain-containing protein
MQARDIMTHSVITAAPETSLTLAQRLMHDHRIRHLLVVSDERLVGLVSDRDLRQASPSPTTTLTPAEITYYMGTTPIATCMTRDVVTIRPEEDLVQSVRRLLERRFDCLPVVADGHLVGLVTATDLLRGVLMATGPAAARTPVRAYMQPSPLTGRPDEFVSSAYQRLHDAHLRHLPIVTEYGQLQGILTDRDIRQAGPSTVRSMAAHESLLLLLTMPVKDIMTSHVYTVRGDTVVADAGQLLLTHKVGCLPVVRQDGTLEGIVTVTDLLRAYCQELER